MQEISKAIVDGSLRAIRDQLARDEGYRIENGSANRAERRRAASIERKQRKKDAKRRKAAT